MAFAFHQYPCSFIGTGEVSHEAIKQQRAETKLPPGVKL